MNGMRRRVAAAVIIAALMALASCAMPAGPGVHRLAEGARGAFKIYRVCAEAPCAGIESSDIRQSEAYRKLGDSIDGALAEIEASTAWTDFEDSRFEDEGTAVYGTNGQEAVK